MVCHTSHAILLYDAIFYLLGALLGLGLGFLFWRKH
jgi:hypothetical protein